MEQTPLLPQMMAYPLLPADASMLRGQEKGKMACMQSRPFAIRDAPHHVIQTFCRLFLPPPHHHHHHERQPEHHDDGNRLSVLYATADGS